MEASITLTPLLALPVLAGLGVIVLCTLLLAIWRGLPGWMLRMLAAAVLLIALAGPTLKQEERDPLKDIVLLLADHSESQKLSQRPAQIETALVALRNEIGALENFELHDVDYHNDPEQENSGSMILSALASAASELAQSRIAGAIVISDGQIHDAEMLQSFPAPVHLLLTGEKNEWDRRLILHNVPAFAIVDETISLKLRIEDQGDVPNDLRGGALLRISVDGQEPREFRVRTGIDLEMPLTLLHGGINLLRFEVVAADSELTDQNNTAIISINGVRDRLQVLLISGEPYAGERTWRNLLKSDSAVDLVHFTILRPPDKQDGVPVNELSLIAFPTRELFLDKIDEFDLIIFDRYRRRGILPAIYLDNVVRYVQEGGAVLVASGPSFASAESLYRTPLSRILPVRPTAHVLEEGYLPRVSETGNRHPVTETLKDFAPRPMAEDGTPGWGRWFRLIDVEQIAGDTVMTGPEGRPLLVLDRVGQGRIAMLASDHAWLWSRGYEGGGPQLELLRRLAHWMMKEPELEEEQLSATAKGRNLTITRRSLEAEQREMRITDPKGAETILPMQELAPGRWQGRFEGGSNGIYLLTDGELNAVAALGPSAPRELEQTIADASLLQPLITATRGGVLPLYDWPTPAIRLTRPERVAAGRGWIGLTPRGAYLTTDIRQKPLAPGWAYLLLACLLIIAAWLYEGRLDRQKQRPNS